MFVAIAFGALVYAFLSDDFSVLFVAQHSNSALPVFYKATAAWGGHEGSMLLWIAVLAVWTMAVAAGSRSQPQDTGREARGGTFFNVPAGGVDLCNVNVPVRRRP